MYGRAVPMLLVDKVEAALDWYRDVLGAEL